MAQIASILEVSGYPKPGNVHRTRDFEDMVFEDFLISGIAIGNTINKAAEKGITIKNSIDSSNNNNTDNINNTNSNNSNNNTKYSNANLGALILEAVSETDRWVANNTNLGIIMLLVPISCAGAMSSNLEELRSNIGILMNNTTSTDAVNLYKAITIADAGGMGEQEEFDVASSDSLKELIENNISMFDVLDISASWDDLARELTTGMPITFDIGAPIFSRLKKTNTINSATLTTFLTILAKIPDTLISRKYNLKKAQDVSNKAQKLLAAINITKKDIEEFDDYLYFNKLNPGTTADLTASSIMVSYLSDYYNSNGFRSNLNK
ncbi:MAG: triphosphoribosyl-dephospho-CoA synthase [Methanobacteriaceae archaeon]